jgi:DNA replication licensing factor MCM4
VVQVRLMRVATQSAATDPTTGTIDMDLITTGRSAASRTLASQLSEALRERFGAMGPQTLRLDELRQSCMADTGLDVPIGALREALGVLERDGLVRLTRQNTVTILS